MRDYSTLLRHRLKWRLVVRYNMNVNERDYPTLQWQIKVKKQLVVRYNMNVNEYERLSNITLRHKLKWKKRL